GYRGVLRGRDGPLLGLGEDDHGIMGDHGLNRGTLLSGQSERDGIGVVRSASEVLEVVHRRTPKGIWLQLRATEPKALLMEANGPRISGVSGPCFNRPFRRRVGRIKLLLDNHWNYRVR